MKTNHRNFKSWHYLLLFVLLCCIITLIWNNAHCITQMIHPDFSSINEYAQFGDSYGAVNALFSGFAFAGVLIALIMQMNELGLQREELKMSRREFTVSRITNVSYKQNELILDAMNSLSYRNSLGTSLKGIDCLTYLRELTNQLEVQRVLSTSSIDEIVKLEKNLIDRCIQSRLLSSDVFGIIEGGIVILDKFIQLEKLTDEQQSLFELFFANIPKELILFIRDLKFSMVKFASSENYDLKTNYQRARINAGLEAVYHYSSLVSFAIDDFRKTEIKAFDHK